MFTDGDTSARFASLAKTLIVKAKIIDVQGTPYSAGSLYID
jgi:hypothetical protein